MPLICYTPRKFSAGALALIEQANTIIGEYQAQGYSLTLRQLYYQFVSRRLLTAVSARWDRITRNL